MQVAFAATNPAGGPLALPNILATGTGNRLGGFFLFHGLPANWTIFAPHILCLLTSGGPGPSEWKKNIRPQEG
jgi:hypothetical protein